MKYNININQLVLSEYENLDIKDMAISDYLWWLCSSVNEKVEKERYKGHTWINYDKLIDDMPALRINSRNSITPRITKLVNSGLFTVVKRMVKGHRRVFVKPTTLMESVFVETNGRVRGNEQRVRETVQDNIIIDNDNIDTSEETSQGTQEVVENKETQHNKNIAQVIKWFEEKEVNAGASKWYSNVTQRGACDILVKKFTMQEIEGAINVLPVTNARPRYEYPLVKTPNQLLDNWHAIKGMIGSAIEEKAKPRFI